MDAKERLRARMEVASLMIDDGASLREIQRTTGMTRRAIVNNFGYRGWTDKKLIGQASRMARELNRMCADD